MADMDLTKEIQMLVESGGDEVAIHEPPCITWKIDHENCHGCPYGLGCGKVVNIILLMVDPYQPKDYDDYARKQERIQGLIDRVLKATTEDELKLIPHQ